MPSATPLTRGGLIATLLGPIQQVLRAILPDFAEAQLKSPATRAAIVLVADAALVRQFPLARLAPPEARRRLIRKQLDIIIDGILLNDSLPADGVGIGFESFILHVESAATAPAQIAERAVRGVLGAAWVVAPLSLDQRSFAATPPDRTLSVQEAWTLAGRLKEQPGISHAEPNIIVPLENLPADDTPPTLATSFFAPKHLPGSKPCEWSLRIINAKEAWQKAVADGRPSQGEGIIVGHPDTGYTRHRENWSDEPAKRRLLFEFGWDFWKNDSDPTDDLVSPIGAIFSGGFVGNPGHGTGTSSVIFSDEGPQPGGSGDYVTGIAPRARLIPFRVAPSVVVWDQRRLADAIKAATDAGCHVISISMGGLPLAYLQKAVLHAVENGVILCAAAGNIFGANDAFHAVVWPAAYGEALAVAASNADNRPWKGSSRGPQVDITAPGESVWRAIAKKGKPLRDVDRGSGTSFAVATVAGVAALWLSYHGRDQLIAAYGKSHLASLFRQIVVTHGFTPRPNWNTGLFGPGIIDALKVISAPLPPPTAMASKTSAEQARFDQFASLFDDVQRPELRRGLARFLGTSEAGLPQVLDEVGDELLYHFFTDATTRDAFRLQLSAKKTSLRAVARTRSAGTRPAPDRVIAAVASPRLAARLRKPPTKP